LLKIVKQGQSINTTLFPYLKSYSISDPALLEEVETLLKGQNFVLLNPRPEEFKIEIYCDTGPAPQTKKGTGGGCFIATAIYGSPFAQEVALLQNLRDEVLMKSSIGLKFVAEYYRFSPTIARVINKSRITKNIVRLTIISPLIKGVKRIVKEGKISTNDF